jgi:hypothetical protein
MNSSRRRPQVQLGIHWRRFAMPQPDLKMLGTVQSGLEIGALARTADGRYVQVNGSILQELRSGRIEAAIQRYRSFMAKSRSSRAAVAQAIRLESPEELPVEVPADRPVAPPPMIVYKKRRFTMAVTETLSS